MTRVKTELKTALSGPLLIKGSYHLGTLEYIKITSVGLSSDHNTTWHLRSGILSVLKFTVIVMLVHSGLCSKGAWVSQATNFCLWVTR